MTNTFLPRPRSAAGVTMAQAAALGLPSLIVAMADPGRYAQLLGVALVVALGWEAVFAMVRGRAPGIHEVTPALIVVIVAPTEIAVWQLMVVMSLGVIFGDLLFGGRGFGFLSPATLALSLLVISFPDLSLPLATRDLVLATLPGSVLLWALGLISGRVLLAAIVAVSAVLALGGQGAEPVAVATGLAFGLAFGLVFLICDPTAAAATNPGRWIYGALAGALVGLFSTNGLTTEAVVFAALMAGVFAPLIDHLVVLAHAYQRGRRQHG